MHTSVLLTNLVSAISFSGANQMEGSSIRGSEVGGRGGGARMGFFTNYLIPMFLHRQDRILPFNFLILFLRATGGRGGGSAGWFRSNFRPPCQKLLDPVLFLFVAI